MDDSIIRVMVSCGEKYVKSRKKVVFFSHNVSSNCVFRTWLLYRALEPYHDVEIIGFDRGGGLWGPIADENLNIRYLTIKGWISLFIAAYRLLQAAAFMARVLGPTGVLHEMKRAKLKHD